MTEKPKYGTDYFEWAVYQCSNCNERYLVDKDDYKQCPYCEYKWCGELLQEGRVNL